MATAIDLRLICMNFTLFEPAIVALKKPSTVCFPGFSAFSEMFGRIRHMMDVFKVVQQKYPTKKLTPKNEKKHLPGIQCNDYIMCCRNHGLPGGTVRL